MSVTPTLTLTEFLLARIAEDETTAASGEHWRMSSDDVYRAESHATNEPVAVEPWGGDVGDRAAHIARHDPARVLADCEAKRRIVALAEDHRLEASLEADHLKRAVVGSWAETIEEDVLPLLALPYTDHPDYREEWKP